MPPIQKLHCHLEVSPRIGYSLDLDFSFVKIVSPYAQSSSEGNHTTNGYHVHSFGGILLNLGVTLANQGSQVITNESYFVS
ncbi:hypothetical protein AAG906_039883 [Vitis piasezkii]